MQGRLLWTAAACGLAVLVATTPVEAGARGHDHYRGYVPGHDRGHGYHRGPWRHYGHGRHRHRHGDEGAYLLGGLVIGAVIGNALAAPPRSYHGEPAYRSRQYPPVVVRRLYRDRHGDCFERHIDAAGRETLLALPAYHCDW